MFIEQAQQFKHDSWRYWVGMVFVFIIWQLGSIPLAVAVFGKVMQQECDLEALSQDPNAIMQVLSPNMTLFLMLLAFAIGLGGLLLWVNRVHEQSFRSLTTSRSKIDYRRFWFGFLLIAGTTLVMTLVEYVMNPESFEVQFNLGPFLGLLIIAVLMIPLQTSFEEYFFRAYIFQGLGLMTRNRWVPLVLTSIVFGGMHAFNPEVEKMGGIIMLYYIGTGLFLGVITLMDEGLELALGFHAGNNLVGALLVTADWTAFQTHSIFKDVSDPSAGLDTMLPVFVIYPLFLWLMARQYGWSDWSRKLIGPVLSIHASKQSDQVNGKSLTQ